MLICQCDKQTANESSVRLVVGHSDVILSAAKDLQPGRTMRLATEILRGAQDDRRAGLFHGRHDTFNVKARVQISYRVWTGVAQPVERLAVNEFVAGSSPASGVKCGDHRSTVRTGDCGPPDVGSIP